jgi:hypothetical protein
MVKNFKVNIEFKKLKVRPIRMNYSDQFKIKHNKYLTKPKPLQQNKQNTICLHSCLATDSFTKAKNSIKFLIRQLGQTIYSSLFVVS